MNRGGPLRTCGRRWPTEYAALHSKMAVTTDAKFEACRFGCGGWHVKAAATTGVSTGPDKLTRDAVYLREKGCCAACGIYLPDSAWRSIQHRVARGQGGGNETTNLVLLCGSATSPGCHRKCEDRDEHMHAAGFWLESWQDPASEPVMLHGADGGITVWLTDDGEYAYQRPEAAA